MKYKPTLLSLLVFVFALQPLWADTPRLNERYQSSSSNGSYLIEMQPEEGSWGGYGKGQGIAYRVMPNDQRESLWKVDFFSSDVILTNDGKHLVAFGPWATQTSDLAIAFYKDGEELKSYTVLDLVQDESKLLRTVSHFFWRKDGFQARKGLSSDEKTYSLPLIDGTTYLFDVSAGTILEKKNTNGVPSPGSTP